MGPLVSRLGTFWSSSSHNTVNFCSIFKNKVSKSKLKPFPCSSYLVSRLNTTRTKLCTFWDTPQPVFWSQVEYKIVRFYFVRRTGMLGSHLRKQNSSTNLEEELRICSVSSSNFKFTNGQSYRKCLWAT